MKLRARHMHLVEALTDNVIGYVINIAATALLFNLLLGHQIPLHDNLIAGVGFFCIALVRKYYIRRFFSNLIQRMFY